jgi:hypothetical protein
MAHSGGFINGVNESTPPVPRFVTINAPLEISSFDRMPFPAFSINVFDTAAISFRVLLFALRITGTTKASSPATAIPAFTSSNILI